MNIYQLEYLVAIAEEGTMQKAAERLFVSQPTLSQSITGLEKELGQFLFHRSAKGMELTEYGAKVYGLAKDALDKIEQIHEVTREYEEHATINVLFIPLLSGFIVPRVVKKFHDRYPNVKVHLEDWSFRNHGSGKVSLKDFTFLLGFNVMGNINVSQRQKRLQTKLAEFRRVAWLNPQSPLVQKTSLAVDDCLGHPILLGDWDEDDFKTLLPGSDLNNLSGMGIQTYLYEDVDAIGILPSLFGVDAMAKKVAEPLVPRNLDFSDWAYTLYAYYDGNRPMSMPEKAFLELLQEECAEAERVAEQMLEHPAARNDSDDQRAALAHGIRLKGPGGCR